MVRPGDRVKDKVTGFTGIVSSRTEYLYGCFRINVQPEELHEGKLAPAATFDEPQLIVIEKQAIESPSIKLKTSQSPGGIAHSQPTERYVPTR